TGIALAKKCISYCTSILPDKFSLLYDGPNKPTSALPNIDFNIAHDGPFVVACSVHCDNIAIGVDVMQIVLPPHHSTVYSYLRSIQNGFHKNEMNHLKKINCQKELLKTILQIW
ncbi:MAG: hypothetical protein MHPSP_002373, partial [Paramarteilia canceri]